MDYQTHRQAAQQALEKAPYNPKKLALLHTGAALLLSLALTVISYLLNRSFNSAVGLSKLEQRAVLQTVQVILSFVNLIISPIWAVSFFAVALRNARWSNAEPRDLLDGFRHWGTVLRLCLLQMGLAFLVMFACSQIAATIFAITPLSRELTRVMEQAMQTGQDPMTLAVQLPLSAMAPLLVLLGVTMALIGIPLIYRFRLSYFAVAEGEPSARKAMAISAYLMRDNRMAMFKLDLHFWWYYIPLTLIGALGYVGNILDVIKLPLPVSRDVIFYGAYGLYLVLHLLLSWRFSMEVRTTYAHVYDELKAQRLSTIPEEAPAQTPWEQPEN